MMLNLPILPIIITLFGALVCFLLKSKKVSLITMIACLSSVLIINMLLMQQLTLKNPIVFLAGGWNPVLGIELKIDYYNILLLSISSICVFILALYLTEDNKEIIEHNIFYCLLLFSFGGFIGILSTNDIFNFYVFLEIASISSYALVTSSKTKGSYLAAFEYLIIGSIASAFILLGIGLLYTATSTLNLRDLALRLKEVYGLNSSKAGLAFLLIGLMLKSAFIPFHNWFIKVYQHSSISLVAFFSATTSNLGVIIIIKLLYKLIDSEFLYHDYIMNFLIITSSITFVICSFKAIFQEDLKAIMAYSSCTHFGYVLLAVSLYTKDSFIAGLLILISHLITKFTIFLILGLMNLNYNSTKVTDLKLFAKNQPFVRVLLIINILFLAGIPFTISFLAKWGILETLLNFQLYLIAICFICSIFCSFLYCGKLIEKLFFASQESTFNLNKQNFYFIKIAISVITFINFLLQINSNKLIHYLHLAFDQ
jgi:multicomponent Na+:H+ antiporter subunit D